MRGTCRLLLVVAAALLFVQPAAAVTTAAPAQVANANLGEEIDIPSSSDDFVLPQTDTASTLTEVVDDLTPNRKNVDYLDFNGHFRTVIKRSEKTREEFSDFVEKTCRDIDSLKTFLSWEHGQFAMHLESNILSIVPGQTADAEVRERLRSLTQPDYDIQAALGNVCKPPPKYDFGSALQLEENLLFENEVVSTSFANLKLARKEDMARFVLPTGLMVTWLRPKKKELNETEIGEVTVIPRDGSIITTEAPMLE